MSREVLLFREIVALDTGHHVAVIYLDDGEQQMELQVPLHYFDVGFSTKEGFYCQASDLDCKEIYAFYYYPVPGKVRLYLNGSIEVLSIDLPTDDFKSEIAKIIQNPKYLFLKDLNHFEPENVIEI